MGEDEIEAHFDYHPSQLTLFCGSKAFERIRALVCSEAKVEENRIAAIRGLDIRVVVDRNAGPSWIKDRIALVGCAFMAFLLGSVFIVGVNTILSWLK